MISINPLRCLYLAFFGNRETIKVLIMCEAVFCGISLGKIMRCAVTIFSLFIAAAAQNFHFIVNVLQNNEVCGRNTYHCFLLHFTLFALLLCSAKNSFNCIVNFRNGGGSTVGTQLIARRRFKISLLYLFLSLPKMDEFPERKKIQATIDQICSNANKYNS